MSRPRVDADVFHAIANPTRRGILGLLAQGERPMLALAETFHVSVPAVSQHLRVLRDNGLVAERRDGRQRIYHLTPEPLREVSEWIAMYERFWKQRLQALGVFLEQSSARKKK